MARGGSRPGAGRPQLSDAEKAARAAARKAAAKAKPAKKPARKVAAKRPRPKAHASTGTKSADAPEQWPFGTQEPAAEEQAPVDPDAEPVISGDSPLAFLLEVV